LVWTLALVGVAIDLVTKYAVFAWLSQVPGNHFVVAPDVFELVAQQKFDDAGNLVPHVNQGALFGLGQRAKDSANTVFAVISLLATVMILFWAFQPGTARDWGLCAALGLILGGTLGNLYDRLMFGGVRDFLHWHYGVDWPVFNLADCCLVTGAGLLLLQAFRKVPDAEKAPHSDAALGTPVSEAHYAAR
jgi:lipoprotein signal peptidase